MAADELSPGTIINTHLVKGEDLNHHKTLYAGRCVEWCVHTAYLTAQSCFSESRRLVFMSIRSLSMRAPAFLGEVVQLAGRIDYIGESTIGVRIDGQKLQPRNDQKPVVTGTFLFCSVDDEGRAIAHGLPASLAADASGPKSRWQKLERDLVGELS
jgi:acyl-CoA hydrolase